MLMLVYRLLAVVTVIGCGAWTYLKPGWDSACALSAALVALIATLVSAPSKAKHRQSQTIGDGGVGIQAGGNVQIGKIERKE